MGRSADIHRALASTELGAGGFTDASRTPHSPPPAPGQQMWALSLGSIRWWEYGSWNHQTLRLNGALGPLAHPPTLVGEKAEAPGVAVLSGPPGVLKSSV